MSSNRFAKLALAGGASVMFYTMVASTALALFLPRVTLQYMTFKVATQKLMVSGHQVDQPDEASFSLVAQFPGTDQLYPGGAPVLEDFWIRNMSSAGQRMRLVLRMSPGNQDWAALQDLVEANLKVYGPNGAESGWQSLRVWTTGEHILPGGLLDDGSRERYEFQYRLRATYISDPDGAGPLAAGSPIGSELMGKTTGGLSMTIDGRVE